jgi:hypothetical protein
MPKDEKLTRESVGRILGRHLVEKAGVTNPMKSVDRSPQGAAPEKRDPAPSPLFSQPVYPGTHKRFQ